jgi:Domain of unknown function (DUF929)
MTGSGPDDGDIIDPDDGDIIEMSPERPRRTWAGRTWLGRSLAERTGAIGRRSRLVLIVAGACVLLAAGGTLAAVRLSSRGPADQALAKLITEVTTVPVDKAAILAAPAVHPAPAVLPTILISPGAVTFHPAYGSAGYSTSSSAGGTASSSSASIGLADPLAAVSGPPLTAGGKPEALYIATEYCPYCVAQNWALIVALSRFGTFSGLRTSRSAHFDNLPPIDGWTFYGSSYASPYLAFVPVESHSNVLVNPKADPGNGKSYRALQQLTPAEQAILGRLDAPGSTPFLDFGGRAMLIGSGIPPEVLAGLTWSQIAADLRQPQPSPGLEILAAANTLTAQFCTLTGNRPAAACPK